MIGLKKKVIIVSTLYKNHLKKQQDVLIIDPFIKHHIEKKSEKFIFKSIRTVDYLKKNNEYLKKSDNYLNRKYNYYCKIFSNHLNNIHGSNYSEEYWKKSLSIGFLRYITLCYNFFLMCEEFIDSNNHVANVLKYKCFKSPNDFDTQRNLLEGSFGQEQLFSIYIRLFYPEIILKEFSIRKNHFLSIKNLINKYKSKITKALIRLKNLIYYPENKNVVEIGVYGSYFSESYMKKLINESKNKINKIIINECPNTNHIRINNQKRKNLKFKAKDRFDLFFINTLSSLFPKSHLEDYKLIESHIDNQFSKYINLKAIINENWIGSTYSSMILSRLKQRSIIHFSNEHNCLFHPYTGSFMDTIIGLCDFFLTIGWTPKSENKKVISVGSLFGFKTPLKEKKEIKILFSSGLLLSKKAILTGAYGYIEEGVVSCIKFEKLFFSRLKSKLKRQIYYRGYPKKFIPPNIDIYDSEFIFKKEHELFKRVSTRESFLDQLSKSEIHICNYLSTTYLQSLASNVPTIIFIPDSFLLSKEYETFFHPLIKCKIAHTDPLECKKHLEDVYLNPSIWWESNLVKENKNQFLSANLKYEEEAIQFYLKLLNEFS